VTKFFAKSGHGEAQKNFSSGNAEAIGSMRGKHRHLPLMETLKEMKREEKDRE